MAFALTIGIVLAIIASVGIVMLRVRNGQDLPLNLLARREKEKEDEILSAVVELYQVLENKYRLYDKYKKDRGYSTRWSQFIQSVEAWNIEWHKDNASLNLGKPTDFAVKVLSYHNGNIKFSVPEQLRKYVAEGVRRKLINGDQV